MVRHPPKLLTRVIRAITKLHEQQGSTVPSIVTQVRIALSDTPNASRNIAMQVRRALKHAVNSGLIVQRAGKFRVVGKRVVPVDSLEMQVDCRKKRTKRRKKKCICGKRLSQHDYHKRHRSPKSSKTTRHKRQKREKSKESGKTQKKNPSRTGSEKNGDQQQQQQEPDNQNANNNMTSRSRSSSPRRNGTNSSSDVQGQRKEQLRGSPYPDSSSDGTVSSLAPVENRRRGRPPRRRRAPILPPPPNRNNQEGPPNVEDEPIDSPPPRRSMPRNVSPKRPSVPRYRENNPDEVRESDTLHEEHEHSPSYYN